MDQRHHRIGLPSCYLRLFPLLVKFYLAACVSAEKELDQKLQVERMFFSGTAYLEKNYLPQARSECLRAIEMDPSYPKLHNGLGRVYFAQGKFDLAEEEFRKTIKLDARFFDAHVNLGALFMKQKEWAKAIASFNELIAFHPQLGLIYMKKKMFKEALHEFRAVLTTSQDEKLKETAGEFVNIIEKIQNEISFR